MTQELTGRRRILACAGVASSPSTFGGTPYYMMLEGKKLGVIDGCAPSVTTNMALKRSRWALSRLISGKPPRGFQFSRAYLSHLWREDIKGVDSQTEVLSLFQLMPDEVFERTRNAWFYVDQTLDQLFSYYGYGAPIPRADLTEIIDRERIQYERSAGVIATSAWAASNLIARYSLPAEKISVLPRGANLDEEAVAEWESGRLAVAGAGSKETRLVFVGKDWRRKGLDRLVAGFKLARREVPLSLLVIGPDRHDVPRWVAEVEGIEWYGFLDKSADMKRYIELVGSCDVGCLLSRAEAGGISLREFHRLGLATLACDTGGTSQFAVQGAGVMIDPDAGEEKIAQELVRFGRDPLWLAELRAYSWRIRHDCGWPSTLRALQTILEKH